MRGLVPRPGIEPGAPCIGSVESYPLDHQGSSWGWDSNPGYWLPLSHYTALLTKVLMLSAFLTPSMPFALHVGHPSLPSLLTLPGASKNVRVHVKHWFPVWAH